jgi:prepilin-type N-terminal cleavage/methylation domain-containing protein
MRARSQNGFTITELIVCVVVFGTLLAFGLMNTAPRPPHMTQLLSNMKQLHLATQQMALDGTTTGDTNLGWPGDTGGTMSGWATRLVKEGYVSTNDLCKLLSARGQITVTSSEYPHFSKTAVLVYAVKEDMPGDMLAFSSANFTNTPTGGLPLDPKAVPYGDRGFVVFRKAGDGAILMGRQVGQTNLIGGFAPLLRP